jgi:hypothetical protein
MDSVSAFGFFVALSQIGLAALCLPPLVFAASRWLRVRRERRVSLPVGARVVS